MTLLLECQITLSSLPSFTAFVPNEWVTFLCLLFSITAAYFMTKVSGMFKQVWSNDAITAYHFWIVHKILVFFASRKMLFYEFFNCCFTATCLDYCLCKELYDFEIWLLPNCYKNMIVEYKLGYGAFFFLQKNHLSWGTSIFLANRTKLLWVCRIFTQPNCNSTIGFISAWGDI